MGVLEQMRSGSDSTFMQVILAMVVVAFVGMYMQPQGEKSGMVASVNGVRIMDTQHNRAYRMEMNNREGRRGGSLSDAEQKQLWEQVRQGLIEREVVLQEAARLGLQVSDNEIARIVVDVYPMFKDNAGKFSLEEYERWLKRNQYTRGDFEEKIREDLLQRKLQQLAFIGASMSEPALKESYVEAETKVNLKMVQIRPGVFDDKVTITDEERTAWLVDNSERVKESYEEDFDRLYNHSEMVRLRLIRLSVLSDGPTLADLVPMLSNVREQIEAGADFADMAKRWSEDPSSLGGGDLGLRPAIQLSLADSEAIEGIEAGGMTKVFTTESDARLILVEEREAPRIDTLEDMTADIADRLIRGEKVPLLAATFAEDELLPQWSTDGVVPEALLSEYRLSARETSLIPTQAGQNPYAPPQIILDAARVGEVGSVLPEVYEEGGVLYVAQLIERTDPDMDVFEERKDEIREGVLQARRNAFYQAWVDDLKAGARIE